MTLIEILVLLFLLGLCVAGSLFGGHWFGVAGYIGGGLGALALEVLVLWGLDALSY